MATFNLSGGSYNLTTVGSYTYTASFGTLTSATASETVVPASLASLTVAGYPSNPNVYSSNTLTVTAKDTYGNLATNFTGSVTITSSDSAATLPSTYFFTSGASGDNGVHTFSVALNTAGTQSITATSGSTTGSQTGISVQKVTPAVTWIPGTNTITYPATLNGLLNATAAYSGNNDSGTPTYTATPSGGSASTVTSSSILTPGTYALAVSFASGTNFNTGTGSVSTFTVNKSTGASISAGSITQTYGTATNETATVNGATFGATPTGNISYSFDSGTATNATLSSGSYSIPVSATLAGGSHTLYISYAGDSNYSGSGVNKTVNFTISTAAPTLGATAVTQTYGTATSTTLSVTGVNGAATPTGTITYSLNGGAGTTVALSGGSYTLQLSATLTGSNTVSFTYGGDTNYSSVTTAKTVNWTVGTIAPTLSGSTVTQTYGTAASVTLSVSGSGVTPTGSITYSLNGGTAATVSLASGSYMLALPATLSAGSNSVSFTYGGDSNYSAVTTAKVVNWTVAQATPTISGSAVTQTYGTATTSTVTVAAVGSGATPAGTITYSIDGGTAQVLTLSGGQASVPIGATLTVGLHNLALTYSGNTSYNGITSGTGTTLSCNRIAGHAEHQLYSSRFAGHLRCLSHRAHGNRWRQQQRRHLHHRWQQHRHGNDQRQYPDGHRRRYDRDRRQPGREHELLGRVTGAAVHRGQQGDRYRRRRGGHSGVRHLGRLHGDRNRSKRWSNPNRDDHVHH